MSGKKKHENHRNPEVNKELQPPADAGIAGGEETIDGIRQARDELMERLQRVSADYLNYQKRVQKDIDESRQYANAGLLKDLLGVIDDMERALAAGRANHPEGDPLVAGMQLVHDKAIETLGRYGVSPIEAEGRPFDPNLHSALMQEASDEVAPGTVLKELQKGYRLKDRTLRPSSVVVAKAPDDEE